MEQLHNAKSSCSIFFCSQTNHQFTIQLIVRVSSILNFSFKLLTTNDNGCFYFIQAIILVAIVRHLLMMLPHLQPTQHRQPAQHHQPTQHRQPTQRLQPIPPQVCFGPFDMNNNRFEFHFSCMLILFFILQHSLKQLHHLHHNRHAAIACWLAANLQCPLPHAHHHRHHIQAMPPDHIDSLFKYFS